MDVVPVANQGENQQNERNQQQPGGLRRIDRVPMVLVRRFVLWLWSGHAPIVAPKEECDSKQKSEADSPKSEVRGLMPEA